MIFLYCPNISKTSKYRNGLIMTSFWLTYFVYEYPHSEQPWYDCWRERYLHYFNDFFFQIIFSLPMTDGLQLIRWKRSSRSWLRSWSKAMKEKASQESNFKWIQNTSTPKSTLKNRLTLPLQWYAYIYFFLEITHLKNHIFGFLIIFFPAQKDWLGKIC